MINLKPTLQKMEIRFLKSVISLMHSSPFVRRAMPRLYQVFNTHTTKVTLGAVAGAIITGGSIGFLLGILAQIL